MQNVELRTLIARRDILGAEYGLGRRFFFVIDRAHGNQRFGILFLWVFDDLINRAVFNHIPHFQDHDIIAYLCDDSEVVSDVERSYASVADRFFDRGQHINLRCDVQSRRRFVKHHQIRFWAKREGCHTALQLSAGHLVRIARTDVVGIGQAQLVKEQTRFGFGICAAELALAYRGFNHLIHDLFGRVKTCRRRLGHIGDFRAAKFAQIANAALQDIAPIYPNFAACQFNTATPIAKCG